MPTQVTINDENFIPIKKARLIIALVLAVYLIIGLVVGYTFIWYPYHNESRYQAEIHDALTQVQRMPNDISARINLGFKYMKAGQYDQAKGEYNAALQIDPNNSIAQMNMAYVDMAMKNYKEADKILGALIKTDHGFQPYFLMGKSAYLQNKYGPAVQNLISAKDMNPTDTETLYYLGMSYARVGQKDNAQRILKSALDFDPKRQDVINELKKLDNK